jgi:hypothetical protein
VHTTPVACDTLVTVPPPPPPPTESFRGCQAEPVHLRTWPVAAPIWLSLADVTAPFASLVSVTAKSSIFDVVTASTSMLGSGYDPARSPPAAPTGAAADA